jgi:hypothetical protein
MTSILVTGGTGTLGRPTVPVRLPGQAFRAFGSGEALVDGKPDGRIIFSEYFA